MYTEHAGDERPDRARPAGDDSISHQYHQSSVFMACAGSYTDEATVEQPASEAARDGEPKLPSIARFCSWRRARGGAPHAWTCTSPRPETPISTSLSNNTRRHEGRGA